MNHNLATTAPTLEPTSPTIAAATTVEGTPATPPEQTSPDVVNGILTEVEGQLRAARLPAATYRIQFNHQCSFREIEGIVPYLSALGISDLYASPFLEARPGSPHGYDIVNHGNVNPEIGTINELRSLRSALREHEMGLIGDVVPNHMSAAPHLNTWWQDVLENGPSSVYATYFDIDWMPLKPDLADKVLLPVLGAQFGKVLEDGQLKVCYGEGIFWLEYFEHRFPLAPQSYGLILGQRLEELRERLGEASPDVQDLLSVMTALKNLPPRNETDADRLAERRREKESIKRRLNELALRSPEITRFIGENITRLNGVPGDPQSFDLLDELLQQQAYRLAFWRVAANEINYRRFFDINDLAAICTEDPRVFEASHRLIFELLDEGTLTGLRIDHPDGLYDPRGYLVHLQEHHFLRLCRAATQRLGVSQVATANDSSPPADGLPPAVEQRLRELWRAAIQIVGSPLARPLYVVVEKILSHNEQLPGDWPVHGTVGYEALNQLNGLFVAPEAAGPFSKIYARFSGESLDFESLTYEDKRKIVRLSMASELNVLGHRLDRISERNRWTRDFTLNSLTHALREVIAGFRVYRSYVQPGHMTQSDREHIDSAVNDAKRRNPIVDDSLFEFVRDVLLLQFPTHADEAERRQIEQFVGKFQQLTGPIMAKAVEDTTFYRFNRLVSLNEVGGDPVRFGVTLAAYHDFNQSRLPWFAQAMNATSTHDTKRSEDVRARINVLSEVPTEWRKRIQAWARWNRRLKTTVNGVEAPSRNAEYLLYQTLVGTWPDTIPTGTARQVYVQRMQDYMVKVIRESKVNTSWVNPHAAYEAATTRFVEKLFERGQKHPFLNDLHEFAQSVADHGRWNSLSQLVLKVAAPGVADFFQGCEHWNLTLVDPDNRRPVDMGALRSQLDELLDKMSSVLGGTERQRAVEQWLNAPEDCASPGVLKLLEQLLAQRVDGRIKLFTTLMTLRARRQTPDLFSRGAYLPLTVIGSLARHVVAFARHDQSGCAVIVVPRLTVGVVGWGGPAPLGDLWKETEVLLPAGLATQPLQDIFTRRSVPVVTQTNPTSARLSVADLLRTFNVAWLRSTATLTDQAPGPA